MKFTKYAIEGMGFTEYPPTDSIEVEFGIIKAFSLEGTNFKKDCAEKKSEVFTFGKNCKILISESINEATKLLTGDVFTDKNEEEWLSEKKAKPPFVLIYYKESSPRILKGGFRQEKDGNIYTYDAFNGTETEINKWEKESLPSIITSLTVRFSTLSKPSLLAPVESRVFGTTKDKKTLFNVKITGGIGHLSVTSAKNSKEINETLSESKDLFIKLSKENCRHFYSALYEKDKLKQFLNYFLFIERFTHSQYKLLSFSKDAGKFFNIPERLKKSGMLFFENRFKDSRNLSQRFHWCAILAWPHIDDQDVICFQELKTTRDKVTHGEDIEETDLPIEKIKKLALKLLGTPET